MASLNDRDIKCMFSISPSAEIGDIAPALEALMEAIGESPDSVDLDERFNLYWQDCVVFTSYPEEVFNTPSDEVFTALQSPVFGYDPRLTFAHPARGSSE